MERWTRLMVRNRWLVAGTWLVVLLAGGYSSGKLPDLLSNTFTMPGTDSERARTILKEHYGDRSDGAFTVVFRVPSSRDPKLRLAKVIPPATWWMEFPEQWNPKSPWSDRRVRLAANLALDKQALNEAERLGFSRLTGSIIPSNMESALRLEPYPAKLAVQRRAVADEVQPRGAWIGVRAAESWYFAIVEHPAAERVGPQPAGATEPLRD